MKRGSERVLERLVRLFNSKNGQEGAGWRGMRVFIPSLTKTSRWWKGTRILRVYVRILRTFFPDIPERDPETLLLVKGYPDTPGICPDTPNIVPGHSGQRPGDSGFGRNTLKISFWSGFWGSQVFV
jgi:hypothetical protein